MINREVTYERNLTGSFLKVPQAFDGAFDEKMMLRKKIRRLLPAEKCYMNGQGQYWYNITGLQSLDAYCHMKEPEYSFVEKLILCVCEEVDLLEQNLIAPESLQFDPEYIFLSQGVEEFYFLIYPGTKADGTVELQKLMDYLITKVSHADPETVKKTYDLYELIRREGSSVGTIRAAVMKQKEERILAESPQKIPAAISQKVSRKGNGKADRDKSEAYPDEQKSRPGEEQKAGSALSKGEFWEKLKVILFGSSFAARKSDPENIKKKEWENKENGKKNNKEDRGKSSRKSSNKWELRSSDDRQEDDKLEFTVPGEFEEDCKTVFISPGKAVPEGILLYEGKEDFQDIIVEEGEHRVGKDAGAEIMINKDTVSHIHACLSRMGNDYYIEDLNSTNGTFLNGEMLPYKEKRALKANDKIRFADVNYRFI